MTLNTSVCVSDGLATYSKHFPAFHSVHAETGSRMTQTAVRWNDEKSNYSNPLKRPQRADFVGQS